MSAVEVQQHCSNPFAASCQSQMMIEAMSRHCLTTRKLLQDICLPRHCIAPDLSKFLKDTSSQECSFLCKKEGDGKSEQILVSWHWISFNAGETEISFSKNQHPSKHLGTVFASKRKLQQHSTCLHQWEGGSQQSSKDIVPLPSNSFGYQHQNQQCCSYFVPCLVTG